MSQTLINSNRTINITREEIFRQVQLSCKIPEIREKIIERKIIFSTVEEAGIEINKEELQKAADNMRASSQLEDAKSTWIWLEKHNLSLEDFEEIVYHTLILGKLANHLFADQVESYFYEHQLDYCSAIIYEVTLDSEDEAFELYYEIKEGEISFFDAAQQYIDDLELRRKGGYRGRVNRVDMKPEISSAVFAAMSPQLLKPIVTASGVYLIFVEEIVKVELDGKLRQTILFDLFSQWLKQQVSEARVANHIRENSETAQNLATSKIC